MRRLACAALFFFSCMPPPPPPPPEIVDARIEFSDFRSDVEIRSSYGDIVLPLPYEWTTLPVFSGLAEGTCGLAIDPTKMMTVLLARIPRTEAIVSALEQQDMRALARASFERRLLRTGNTIRVVEGFGVIARDSLRFGTYSFVEQLQDTAMLRRTRVAVLHTPEGSVYELALSPIVLSLDRIPDERQLDSTFRFLLQIVRLR